MGTRASRRRTLPLHKKMSFLALHVTADIASSFTFNTDALYSIVTLLAGEDARVPMSIQPGKISLVEWQGKFPRLLIRHLRAIQIILY